MMWPRWPHFLDGVVAEAGGLPAGELGGPSALCGLCVVADVVGAVEGVGAAVVVDASVGDGDVSAPGPFADAVGVHVEVCGGLLFVPEFGGGAVVSFGHNPILPHVWQWGKVPATSTYDQHMPSHHTPHTPRLAATINAEIRALWHHAGNHLTTPEQRALYAQLVTEWATAIRTERDTAEAA